MFKIYQKYLIKKFITKFINIFIIFFCLIFILNTFEEINFFKKVNSNFLLPYFISFLNTPIVIFEILPFIFLLSSQFFFYEIFKKDELNHLKTNGLNNIKIIILLFITTFISGIFAITIYYNISSKLKFFYTDIKNTYSNDNKYLAVVTDNGLWLKDEINNSILITKANNINENLLLDVVINEFNENFDLKRVIQSEKVNISNYVWIIHNPITTIDNISKNSTETLNLLTNFDKVKINNLFSNISTLNIFELFNLKNDFEKLGYSSDEIKIYILKLFTTPYLYGLMTILSSIIMLNLKKNSSLYFHVILGVFLSVSIYYISFIFSSLGNAGKLPPDISVFLPILLITISVIIGLITINEK